MGLMAMMKNMLVRAGWLPAFDAATVADAETENLVVDRERAMGRLRKQTEHFYSQSADIEQRVQTGKEEVNSVAEAIRQSTKHAVDARSIFENMIARREIMQRRRNRKFYGHD